MSNARCASVNASAAQSNGIHAGNAERKPQLQTPRSKRDRPGREYSHSNTRHRELSARGTTIHKATHFVTPWLEISSRLAQYGTAMRVMRR